MHRTDATTSFSVQQLETRRRGGKENVSLELIETLRCCGFLFLSALFFSLDSIHYALSWPKAIYFPLELRLQWERSWESRRSQRSSQHHSTTTGVSSNKILLFVFSYAFIWCALLSDMGRLLGVGILRKTTSSEWCLASIRMEVKQKVHVPTNEMEHFWNFEQISLSCRFDYWEIFSFLFAWLYRKNIESVRDSLVTYPIDISLIIRSWWWSWNMTQKLDIVPGSNHRRRWQRQQYDVMNSILFWVKGVSACIRKMNIISCFFSAKVGTQNGIDEKSRVLFHNSPIHRRKKEKKKNCSMKPSAECRAADRSSESDAMCLFNLLKLHYDSLPCLCPIQHTYFFWWY